MVDLSSIMSFKNGAQGASSIGNVQGAEGAQGGAPGGNMLSGILGGGPSYAEKNPMSGELPEAPQLSTGRESSGSESKPASTSTIPPPKLESGPSGSLGQESEMPDKLKSVGEKPKTIADENYQEAMSRGKFTPAQWLTENAKAAKNGEREPLSIGETLEVLRDSDNLNETPDERKKREKREGLGKAFSTFGNIAANIANFAFATQGGVPGDYNNKAATEREKEIEARRQKLKEKYDDIIMNAKGDDIKYARSLEAARQKTNNDNKYKDQSHQLSVDKFEHEKTRQAGIDAETVRHHKETEETNRQNANTRLINANKPRSGKSGGGSGKEYKFAISTDRGDYTLGDKSKVESIAARLLPNIIELETNGIEDDDQRAKVASSIGKDPGRALQQYANKHPEILNQLEDHFEFTPREGYQEDMMNKFISVASLGMTDQQKEQFRNYISSRTPDQLSAEYGDRFPQIKSLAKKYGIKGSASNNTGDGGNKKSLGIGLGK